MWCHLIGFCPLFWSCHISCMDKNPAVQDTSIETLKPRQNDKHWYYAIFPLFHQGLVVKSLPALAQVNPVVQPQGTPRSNKHPAKCVVEQLRVSIGMPRRTNNLHCRDLEHNIWLEVQLTLMWDNRNSCELQSQECVGEFVLRFVFLTAS